MKKIMLTLAIVFTILLPLSKTKALTGEDAYKAIVKIYTYYEGSDYSLTAVSTGSGVFITSDGMILTNNHVVAIKDGFDNELPAAYKICATAIPTEEPDCRFSADLIAKDEDKDIALLKIKNISLTNISNFDYLNRPSVGNYKDGDVVQALGYPSSGGETITGTIGTISGSLDKYGLSWIKTSALVSFGSSGGALIDLEGNLLGITSQVYSDLGYAINITSLNNWIADNLAKPAIISSLQNRMNNLIIEQDSLKSSSIFVNDLPSIIVNSPHGWEIKHEAENYAQFKNKENLKGGIITVNWAATDTNFAPMLDISAKYMTMVDDYFLVGKTKINGIEGRKLIKKVDNEEVAIILLPSKNYAVKIAYYYGEKQVDKEMIDRVLSGIKLSDANNKFKEKKSYENKTPFFKFSAKNDWVLMGKNMMSNPIVGQKKSVPAVGYSFYVTKLTDNMKQMDNKSYFDYIKNDEFIKVYYEDLFDFEAERYGQSLKYKINNELNNAIFYKYKFKDKNDGNKCKFYAAGYRILMKDYVLTMEFTYIGDSQKQFENNLADFNRNVLSALTLKQPSSVKK